MRRSIRRLPQVLVAVALAASVAAGCSSGGGGGTDVKLSAQGEKGKAVAAEKGCVACHTADGGRSTGPTWKGLAGSKVDVDGRTVVASDAYLRRSIADPHAQVVDGFADIMPSYTGKLSATEITQLLAYLHDLAPKAKAATG